MAERTCPVWLEAYLAYLSGKLETAMWNVYQKEYESPFFTEGGHFTNGTFAVYGSDDDSYITYNFKWKDIEISWYKRLGRGMSVNRRVSHTRGEKMLNTCLASLGCLDKIDPASFVKLTVESQLRVSYG